MTETMFIDNIYVDIIIVYNNKVIATQYQEDRNFNNDITKQRHKSMSDNKIDLLDCKII